MKQEKQHRSTEALASEFLDLWQDNIRAWAIERELLTPADLLDLLQESSSGHKPDAEGVDPK